MKLVNYISEEPAASIFEVEGQAAKDKNEQDIEKRSKGACGGANSRWQRFSVCVRQGFLCWKATCTNLGKEMGKRFIEGEVCSETYKRCIEAQLCKTR